MCAALALTPEVRDDHASYIASWLKVLKDDKRAVFTAASHAQKAADFLSGSQKPQEAEQAASPRFASNTTGFTLRTPGLRCGLLF